VTTTSDFSLTDGGDFNQHFSHVCGDDLFFSDQRRISEALQPDPATQQSGVQVEERSFKAD
jgi:hypothetical protein